MQVNVLDYLDATASQFPDHVAISEKARRVTFATLRAAALRIACRIIALADVVNEPVAIYLPKSIEAIASIAGILYSANFYVPLDVKLPTERLRAILGNLSPVVALTNEPLLQSLLAAGFSRERIVVLGDATVLDSEEPDSRVAHRHHRLIDTDPAYVIYTSGSTGVPKGVTIPHRGIIDYIDWANGVYAVGNRDIIGSQAPFFFDNSTLDIYLCFSRAATLHLIPEDLFAFPVKLVEHVQDAGITTIFWVPSLMTAIAHFDIFASVPLPAMNKVLFAGEVMPARTLTYWRRHLPGALFSNLYGPTEITVDCTYYVVDRDFADDEPVPIGHPCRNSDVLILSERDTLAADGESGELCVRGSSLALGYWNAPEKTTAAFVQNPLRPQYPERIYRTGDIVQRNQRGELVFLGRKDSQIKHQGYRIELGEIEMAAAALDGIGAVCVLYNQTAQEITLFYEAAAEVPVRQLRDRLSRSLPRYMMPAVFRWIEAMPMNANGKTDRVSLAKTYFQS